jgi:hypothetical protein
VLALVTQVFGAISPEMTDIWLTGLLLLNHQRERRGRRLPGLIEE